MTPVGFVAGATATAIGFTLITGRKPVLGNNGPMLVKGVGNGGYMRADAADAFNAMAADAAAEGVTLLAGSAFRSIIEQTKLYLAWKAGTYNVPSVARPGTSNHGNGTAVDVASSPGVSLGYGSSGYTWLLANASNYGFSWDEGRAVNEPWHWRFVG